MYITLEEQGLYRSQETTTSVCSTKIEISDWEKPLINPLVPQSTFFMRKVQVFTLQIVGHPRLVEGKLIEEDM